MKKDNNLIFTINTNPSRVDPDREKIHHILGGRRRSKKEVEIMAGDRDRVYFFKLTSLRFSHLGFKNVNVMDVLCSSRRVLCYPFAISRKYDMVCELDALKHG